jgi:hypothetical protein
LLALGLNHASSLQPVTLLNLSPAALQLLGAWLADSLWGRYKTILVFSTIYFAVGGGRRLACCSKPACYDCIASMRGWPLQGHGHASHTGPLPQVQ